MQDTWRVSCCPSTQGLASAERADETSCVCRARERLNRDSECIACKSVTDCPIPGFACLSLYGQAATWLTLGFFVGGSALWILMAYGMSKSVDSHITARVHSDVLPCLWIRTESCAHSLDGTRLTLTSIRRQAYVSLVSKRCYKAMIAILLFISKIMRHVKSPYDMMNEVRHKHLQQVCSL
eukprot:4920534-Amphidinium_carterae.2